jgi:hypothetical protein
MDIDNLIMIKDLLKRFGYSHQFDCRLKKKRFIRHGKKKDSSTHLWRLDAVLQVPSGVPALYVCLFAQMDR